MYLRIRNCHNGWKVKRTTLILLAIVLVTVEIPYLTFISMPIRILYLLAQALVIGWGLLQILLEKSGKTDDILLLLFILIEFLSTMMKHIGLQDLILNTKTLLLFYVSFKFALRKRPEIYVRLMSGYLLFLTTVNTVTALVCYPDALFYYDRYSPAFFLGGDNTSTRIYILAIAVCFAENAIVRGGYKKRRFTPLISIVNFVVFSFVRDIGNGKVCSILLLIGFIFFEIIKVPMINKPMKKVILGNYILFFLMVVMNKLNVFSFIIVNLLHRDLTLTTRTTIWKIAMEKIASDPIWGNGYLSGAEFESLLPSIIGVNAHNTILMVAFIGGVALSVVFLMVLFHSTNLYDRLPNIQKLWFLPVVLLAMFLRSQVEGGDAVYLIATATLIASIVKYCPISEQE